MQTAITNIVSGSKTGGAFAVFAQITGPGYAPPLHRHTVQMETLHVLRGLHKFQIAGEEFMGRPGDCFFVPQGVAHGFKNIDSVEGLLHFILVPSGTSEQFFADLPVERAKPTLDLDFFQRHGVDVVGDPIA